MSTAASGILKKQKDEIRPYDMDFRFQMEPGQSITAVNGVTASPTTVPALILYPPTFSGTLAQVIMEGGLAGTSYEIKFDVTTDGAERLVGKGTLDVVNSIVTSPILCKDPTEMKKLTLEWRDHVGLNAGLSNSFVNSITPNDTLVDSNEVEQDTRVTYTFSGGNSGTTYEIQFRAQGLTGGVTTFYVLNSLLRVD